MISNSTIFTSTLYGNSSGGTAQELADKAKTTKEIYLSKYSDTNMRTILPTVPSNQQVARDK